MNRRELASDAGSPEALLDSTCTCEMSGGKLEGAAQPRMWVLLPYVYARQGAALCRAKAPSMRLLPCGPAATHRCLRGYAQACVIAFFANIQC